MNARVLDEALLKAKTKDEIEEILKILESHEQSLNDIYLYGDNSRFSFNQKTANQQLEKIQGDQKVTAS